ncbi:MAG: glycerophosphodiester phosphodiesterase, partial [Anaerolineaceae bacterium]|nr:glycerophosphodiester phosphodiesterase [Anaerolineaceae bacterium]
MNLQSFSKPVNIAHRGARSLAPENTLAAARKGFALGADAWELDVQVSADNDLVICHDSFLARTSNVAWIFPERVEALVHTFTLAELRQLDFGSWFNQVDPFQQIAAGNVTPEMQQSYIGEPILTLEDALLFTRENAWQVNVEIKNAVGTPGDAFVVEKVVEMIGALGMIDSVLVSSFNHDYLRRVKAATPQVAIAPIVEFPLPDPLGLVRELGAFSYHPGGRALHPEEFASLIEAGFKVYPWTINDPRMMRALLRSGASGIITDFPQLLREIIG